MNQTNKARQIEEAYDAWAGRSTAWLWSTWAVMPTRRT